MTLRDILSQHLIQGKIVVKIWDDEKEDYKVNEPLTDSNRKKYLDLEIRYLYAMADICQSISAALVFELQDEEATS